MYYLCATILTSSIEKQPGDNHDLKVRAFFLSATLGKHKHPHRDPSLELARYLLLAPAISQGQIGKHTIASPDVGYIGRLKSSSLSTPQKFFNMAQVIEKAKDALHLNKKDEIKIAGHPVHRTGYGLMGLTWRANPPPQEQAFEAMSTLSKNLHSSKR